MYKVKTNRVDLFLFLLLVLLIFWMPIPLGSIHPLELGFFQITSFLLVLFWLLSQISILKPLPAIIKQHQNLLVLFTLCVAYQLIYLIPLSPGLLEILSPKTLETYELTSVTEIRNLTLSYDIGLSLNELLKSAAYLSVFILIVLLVSNRTRLVLISISVCCVGLLNSAIGFIKSIPLDLFFSDPLSAFENANRVYGTYGNPSHFAGLLEVSIPITLGLIIATSQQSSLGDFQQKISDSFHKFIHKTLWLYLALVIMILAMLFSGSRGGNFSLILALLTSGILLIFIRGFKPRENIILLMVILAMMTIFAVIGTTKLSTIYLRDGTSENLTLRGEYIKASIKIFREYPVLGVGSGNWQYAFPMYVNVNSRASQINRNVAHAHNDYLELLNEQGIIGFALNAVAVSWIIFLGIQGIRQKHDPLIRGVLYGALTAIFSLLIHALIDFNFHIPANMSYFFIMMALVIVASSLPDKKTQERSSTYQSIASAKPS